MDCIAEPYIRHDFPAHLGAESAGESAGIVPPLPQLAVFKRGKGDNGECASRHLRISWQPDQSRAQAYPTRASRLGVKGTADSILRWSMLQGYALLALKVVGPATIVNHTQGLLIEVEQALNASP